MRGMGLIAVVVLLTGCGREGAAGEAGPNAELPAQELNEANAGAPVPPEPAPQAANAVVEARPAGPCLMQGQDRLDTKPIRAVGTEPFWSARIEGRCVTYSTPDDQQGTRVWTRYSAGPGGGGNWVGQLNGQKFEMRTRPEAGCSDGMSDKSYPIAVELTVGGEQRRGCAEPL